MLIVEGRSLIWRAKLGISWSTLHGNRSVVFMILRKWGLVTYRIWLNIQTVHCKKSVLTILRSIISEIILNFYKEVVSDAE